MAELRVPRILWVALLISTFLYVVMWFMTRGQHGGAKLEPMFPLVFAVAALGCAVASFVVPNSGYRRAVQAAQLPVTFEADPNAASDVIPTADAPMRKVFAKPKAARRRALAVYQTPFILGMALSEAVCLIGFSLGFLGYPVVYWAPFFVVTWILFAIRFPTEDAVFGRFARTYGAAFPAER